MTCILTRPRWMNDALFKRLINSEDIIDTDTYSIRLDEFDIKKATLCGIIFFNETTGFSNASMLDQANLFQNHTGKPYLGNTQLMSSMIYLHNDFYNKLVRVMIDPFGGQGGSLIAAFEFGVEQIITNEINPKNYFGSLQNFEEFLIKKKTEYDKEEFNYNSEEIIWTNYALSTGQCVTVYCSDTLRYLPWIMKKSGITNASIITDVSRASCQKEKSSFNEVVEFRQGEKLFYEQFVSLLSQVNVSEATLTLPNGLYLHLANTRVIVQGSKYDICCLV